MGKKLKAIRLRECELKFLEEIARENELFWNDSPNISAAVLFLIKQARLNRNMLRQYNPDEIAKAIEMSNKAIVRQGKREDMRFVGNTEGEQE